MSRLARPKRRDPRHFRGDVVETLNRLQNDGVITGYRLPPRERGEIEVSQIAVLVPQTVDPVSALTVVSDSLRELPHFDELGGIIVLDQGTA